MPEAYSAVSHEIVRVPAGWQPIRAAAFGMNLTYYDIARLTEDQEDALGVPLVPSEELETALKQHDETAEAIAALEEAITAGGPQDTDLRRELAQLRASAER